MNRLRRGGSAPNKMRYVCYQASDERCSSLNCSGAPRFHVSALYHELSRVASRRTASVVRHDHQGSYEVELGQRRAIKAIDTGPRLRDSPAPWHIALSTK